MQLLYQGTLLSCLCNPVCVHVAASPPPPAAAPPRPRRHKGLMFMIIAANCNLMRSEIRAQSPAHPLHPHLTSHHTCISASMARCQGRPVCLSGGFESHCLPVQKHNLA
jgi:hypothetical protein